MKWVETCPVCDGRDFAPFAMARGRGLHASQVRCRCGLLISQPQADSDELRRFYESTYYDELWTEPPAGTSECYRRDELPLMRRLWADWPPRGTVAVDVGCGYGEMMTLLDDAGFRVRGCDAGARAVAHCRARGLEVVQALWPSLPFAPGQADLAISLQVIEHVSDPRAFVRDLIALVKPGGVVVIATEDACTSQHVFERLVERARARVPAFRSSTDHTFVFSPHHLRALLEQSGCEVRTVTYSRVPPERLHWKLYKGLFRTLDRFVGHGDYLMAVGRRR
jgi:2-polyprenyl-3-methyl-5-hydroxy-6-metoxy-1,4-benzoquinol methylase